MADTFYITTAIDYVNGVPHAGHALEKIQADCLARYNRLLGKEVFFLVGTDEHGIKIVRTAQIAGKNIEEFAIENADKFKKLWEELNISNDDFIKTSDKERHWPGAQELWRKLAEAGDIYKGEYKGFYCVGCEAYITEKGLVDGKCPIHDKEPEAIDEENYFFKLSRHREEIKKRIESDELKVVPETRKNEVLKMIETTEDVSFSRPKEKLGGWGIPVPDDDDHLMYVWCDALSSYISALGYGGDDENFKKFWPAQVHVIGKDILRFHAIIWPAMLLSAGLPLPEKIFVHGFILSGGKKMSKSIGNVIDPFNLINEYGEEALRFYLLHEVTPFEDGDITEDKFKEAYNAYLANGLGNLVSRIMKMITSYNVDISDIVFPETLPEEYKEAFDNFEIHAAAKYVWDRISELDASIQKKEPFKKIKENPAEAKSDLSELAQGLADISVILGPFLPETSEKIKELLKERKNPEEALFLRKD